MDKATYKKLESGIYELKDLVERFAAHADEVASDKSRFDVELNLPKALLTFAIEINNLKESLESFYNEYYGYD